MRVTPQLHVAFAEDGVTNAKPLSNGFSFTANNLFIHITYIKGKASPNARNIGSGSDDVGSERPVLTSGRTPSHQQPLPSVCL